MRDYVEISFQVEQRDAEPATRLMQIAGALSVTVESASLEDCFDESVPCEPSWPQQRLTGLFDEKVDLSVIRQLVSETVSSTQAWSVGLLEDCDWERVWLTQFRPVKVGKRLWVRPSWTQAVVPDEVNMIIDPGLAFGTGTHPTTCLCLEYLSACSLTGKTVLDFGCGSGILGIAATMLGAVKAMGVDVDARAIQATRNNATANQVDDRLVAVDSERFVSQYSERQFDLVMANILAGTLTALVDELVVRVKQDGVILLSGILPCQQGTVLAAYEAYFDFTTRQKDDWLLMIGRRYDN